MSATKEPYIAAKSPISETKEPEIAAKEPCRTPAGR